MHQEDIDNPRIGVNIRFDNFFLKIKLILKKSTPIELILKIKIIENE